MINIQNGLADSEADIYFYNFGNKTGRFFWNKSKFVTIPYSKLEISEPNGHGNGFLIVDENGVRYTFLTHEVSISSNSDYTTKETSNKSAWFMNKITDPTENDSIIFSYTPFQVPMPTLLVSETKKRLSMPVIAPLDGLPTQINKTTYFDQTLMTQICDSVKANGFTLDIYYSYRSDISDKKIDSIVIYDIRSNVQKRMYFFYSYSSAGEKMFLDSLKEIGYSIELSKTTKFNYYQKDEIPSINSKSIDHWGFYNGTENSTLVPTFSTYNGVELGGNRYANPLFTPYGTLISIVYPTGGCTKFEYEQNNYSRIGGNYITSQKTIDKQVAAYAIFTNSPKSIIKTFTLNSGKSLYISYSVSNCDPNYSGCRSYLLEPSTGTIQLINTDNNQIYFNIDGGSVNVADTKNTIINIPSGNYALTATANTKYDKTRVNMSYSEIVTDTSIKAELGGGLRIKNIKNYNSITESIPISTRSFDYQMPSNTNYSSGIALNEPIYSYYYTEYLKENGGLGCDIPINFTINTSFSNNQLGTSKGSYVGYETVTENFVSKDNTYKKIYYFSSAKLYGDIPSNYYLFPSTSYDYKRGLLIKTLFFNANNKLVKSEINNYQFQNDFFYSEVKNFKASQSVYCSATQKYANGTYYPQAYNTGYYKYISQWVALDNDSTIEYSEYGTPLISYRKYVYDTTTLLPKQIISFDSKGNKTIEKISYILNHPVISNSVTPNLESLITMQNKHMISSKVEQYKIKEIGSKNVVTDGMYYTYNPVSLKLDTLFYFKTLVDENNFLPSVIGEHGLLKDAHYEFGYGIKYDEKNNIKVFFNKYSPNEVYLWGYNSQYPIAKVIGSNYETISGIIPHSTVDNLINSTSYSDAKLRELLKLLRTNNDTKNAQVWSYTYKPLVGVTSETDPKGNTVFYEYDGFGRLILIKDKNGKIFKKNNYHLLGQ